MTDQPQGPDWWQASDLKWYPPEKRPDPAVLPPPPAADAIPQHPADSALAASPAPPQPQKATNTRQVIPRDKLGVLTKIGQGGQGVVYGAPKVKTTFAASMVYKEYKAQTRADIDFTALAAMPALVEESLTYAQAERLISMAAWPCALVEDNGTATGFVMPAIPQEFFIPLTTVKGVSTTTAEFQHLLNHSSVLAARGIELDDAQRCTLLREVASGLAFLHKHGVCVGDISPKNLLFSLTPHEAVYFIDCDAMRINGISALPQVETPGWDTPSGEELATIYSDTYKLGLLALRLVTGDHDTKTPQHLPSTTPDLLRQIITDTLTNPPQRRPLPEAWTYVLGNAIEQAQHHNKLTAAPAPAAPTPPPIPQVRSRPTPNSGPPVRSSAPQTPIVHSRPPVGPSAHPQVGEPPPPPPGPLAEYPPQPRPVRAKAKPSTLGGILAIVVLVAVGVVGNNLYNNAHRQPPSQSAPVSAAPPTQPAPPPGPKPVEEAALDGLLLSPEQINTAMTATGMKVNRNWTGMFTDDSSVTDKACAVINSPADVTTYAGSRSGAVRAQEVTNPQKDPLPGPPGAYSMWFTDRALQTVVLFASAHDADAFFTASAQSWPACANRQYAYTQDGYPDRVYTVGPVSNANGTLSTHQTLGGNWSWQSCQRALTVANNVAIDIETCSEDTQSEAAIHIAQQIAAKVPTT